MQELRGECVNYQIIGLHCIEVSCYELSRGPPVVFRERKRQHHRISRRPPPCPTEHQSLHCHFHRSHHRQKSDWCCDVSDNAETGVPSDNEVDDAISDDVVVVSAPDDDRRAARHLAPNVGLV